MTSSEKLSKLKEFYEREVVRINNIAEGNELVSACIVYYNPVFEKYTSRVGLFESEYEARLWLKHTTKFYTEQGIEYHIFIKGEWRSSSSI